jgi:hypothetical protein
VRILLAGLFTLALASIAVAEEGPKPEAPTQEQLDAVRAEAKRWQAIAASMEKQTRECSVARAMEAAEAAGGN